MMSLVGDKMCTLILGLIFAMEGSSSYLVGEMENTSYKVGNIDIVVDDVVVVENDEEVME